ncbi:MAG: (p)ppGpp synthetase [Fibrobacter sp.]|nr:(p)ppGpp synthetase [Fibrobacter sp.]
MDLHSEMILDEYREKRASFEVISKIVVEKLHAFVAQSGLLVNSISARIKTSQSLAGKLERKGSKYRNLLDITDILGARIVTYFNDEVDIVADMVTKHFEIDWENSVDKRKLLDPDRFGYLSLHYICRIPESMYSDPDHPEINQYRFEIQLRSALQDVWATIFHDTGYKSDFDVPREYVRSMNRLAGLLEVADNEFKNIRDGLHAYREKIHKAIFEKRYSEVQLDADSFKCYLETRPFDALNQRIAKAYNLEIQDASFTSYLFIFNKMGFKTIEDIEQMIRTCSADAYALAASQFAGKDLDIMASTVGIRNLCHVYILHQGKGLEGLIWLQDIVYGQRPSNKEMAERIFKKAKSIGIGQESASVSEKNDID